MQKINRLIAEIGQNHMGDEKYAIELLNSVIKNKYIDAVTFQIREENFYKNKRKKLILRDSFYTKVRNITKKSKKEFGIALCDPRKIKFFEKLNIDFVKIINNDINNNYLLEKLFKSNISKIYFSTGLSDEKDIINLLKKLKYSKKKYEIIHTTLSNDIKYANLNSIKYLKKIVKKIPVAFGLHSEFWEVLLLSLSFRPSSIFFYIKGNKYKIHGDEKHAIKTNNLNRVTSLIKLYPKILGKFDKKKPKKILNYK